MRRGGEEEGGEEEEIDTVLCRGVSGVMLLRCVSVSLCECVAVTV